MKDLISKIAFGFLMAQLFPGAIVVFAFTCALVPNVGRLRPICENVLCKTQIFWFQSTFRVISFIFVATAIGMFIHGLNWAILARLENRDPKEPKPVRKIWYHQLLLLLQFFASPFIILGEIIYLIFTRSPIDQLTMNENVSELNPKYNEYFQFLQEFYLHFGQFYAHVAYAFWFSLLTSVIYCVWKFSGCTLIIFFLLYIMTSVFFLLGRIQLSSLFKAERALVDRSKTES